MSILVNFNFYHMHKFTGFTMVQNMKFYSVDYFIFLGLTGVWFYTLATGRSRLQTVYSNISYMNILLESEFDIKYHLVDFLRW